MIIDIVPVDGCKVRGNPERQNIIDFKINVFEMITRNDMIIDIVPVDGCKVRGNPERQQSRFSATMDDGCCRGRLLPLRWSPG